MARPRQAAPTVPPVSCQLRELGGVVGVGLPAPGADLTPDGAVGSGAAAWSSRRCTSAADSGLVAVAVPALPRRETAVQAPTPARTVATDQTMTVTSLRGITCLRSGTRPGWRTVG